MGYAEAIEQQVATLDTLRSPVGLALMRTLLDLWSRRGSRGQLPSAERSRRWACDILERAEPFYVERDICAVLDVAQATLPDHVVRAENLPTSAGWVYLAVPVRCGESELRAFAWAESDPGSYQFVFLGPGDDAGLRCPLLFLAQVWEDGDRWLATAESPNRGLARFVAAFFAFVQQRILVGTTRRVLNRAARRRIARTLPIEPLVRVVELRRRAYTPREASEHEPAEWSCQWVVRGHWHRYHTREGLQPRWVNPYVKGPDDKPFKAPRATVYEVVR
jgi:hypothetical protein